MSDLVRLRFGRFMPYTVGIIKYFVIVAIFVDVNNSILLSASSHMIACLMLLWVFIKNYSAMQLCFYTSFWLFRSLLLRKENNLIFVLLMMTGYSSRVWTKVHPSCPTFLFICFFCFCKLGFILSSKYKISCSLLLEDKNLS